MEFHRHPTGERKMANKLAPLLNKAKHNGINEGLLTGEKLTLIALCNIVEDYIEEERIGAFLKDTENEMRRVWNETIKYMDEEHKTNKKKSLEENSYTVGEYLIGQSERLRKKWGMDDEN